MEDVREEIDVFLYMLDKRPGSLAKEDFIPLHKAGCMREDKPAAVSNVSKWPPPTILVVFNGKRVTEEGDVRDWLEQSKRTDVRAQMALAFDARLQEGPQTASAVTATEEPLDPPLKYKSIDALTRLAK